jgi:hypothetical protein
MTTPAQFLALLGPTRLASWPKQGEEMPASKVRPVMAQVKMTYVSRKLIKAD